MTITKLRLRKLNNTRDLGGFPAADGKKIKSGKLIRSGKMYHLPRSTCDAFKKMGTSVVMDLRIDNEVEEYPDTLIEGAAYVRLPLICTNTPGVTFSKSMMGLMRDESKLLKTENITADEYMHNIYSGILFDDDSKKLLREVFDVFLNAEGCVVWHCSSGKDRAGIVAMLIESVLGVDEDLVMQDYVASERFQKTKRNWEKAGLAIVPISIKFKRLLFAFMAAKEEYMRDALDELKEKYGSVIGYCKSELSLTDEEIAILRDKYLED